MSASPGPRRYTVAWGLVLAGLALAGWLWVDRGSPPRAGGRTRVRLTVVTADKDELACAFDGEIVGHRCEYRTPETKWSEEEAPRLSDGLAPYVTTGRNLVLLAGLFDVPAVARRYEQERLRGKVRAALRRFEVDCEAEILGEATGGFHVRFGRTGRWTEQKRAWALRPFECAVSERPIRKK